MNSILLPLASFFFFPFLFLPPSLFGLKAKSDNGRSSPQSWGQRSGTPRMEIFAHSRLCPSPPSSFFFPFQSNWQVYRKLFEELFARHTRSESVGSFPFSSLFPFSPSPPSSPSLPFTPSNAWPEETRFLLRFRKTTKIWHSARLFFSLSLFSLAETGLLYYQHHRQKNRATPMLFFPSFFFPLPLPRSIHAINSNTAPGSFSYSPPTTYFFPGTDRKPTKDLFVFFLFFFFFFFLPPKIRSFLVKNIRNCLPLCLFFFFVLPML